MKYSQWMKWIEITVNIEMEEAGTTASFG